MSTTVVDGGEPGREGNVPPAAEVWSTPGTVLGGRFVVERRLGGGGMGYVVAARHLELEESVAIKLIQPSRALSKEAQNRLVREARAAAKIRSAHVVRIFDVVSRGRGAPYLVMECLEGETVAQLVERTGPLAVERAVEIVVQACEAIAEAHRNGTIHRDLKPSNLFLTSLPGRAFFVKVLDFGIAKVREEGESTLTQSDALLGSPAYAAPEQLRASKEVDERADIWSLGVILYQCLTGRLPFRARALAELCGEIMRDAPLSPSAHRSDVPRRLELAILKCLAKEPGERFASVEDLVRALEGFAPAAARECLNYVRDLPPKRGLPASSRDTPVTASHPDTLTHASVASPSERTSIQRAWLPWLGAALAVAALGTFISNGGSGNEPAGAVLATAKPPAAITEVEVTATKTSSREPERPTASATTHDPPGARAERRVSGTKPSARSTTARASEQRDRASSPVSPVQSAPPPLELLPLDDLIDERK